MDTLFSSNNLLQVQNLETIHSRNWDIDEISVSQTDVEIPILREVYLNGLHRLKYIWKSNQWTYRPYNEFKSKYEPFVILS